MKSTADIFNRKVLSTSGHAASDTQAMLQEMLDKFIAEVPVLKKGTHTIVPRTKSIFTGIADDKVAMKLVDDRLYMCVVQYSSDYYYIACIPVTLVQNGTIIISTGTSSNPSALYQGFIPIMKDVNDKIILNLVVDIAKSNDIICFRGLYSYAARKDSVYVFDCTGTGTIDIASYLASQGSVDTTNTGNMIKCTAASNNYTEDGRVYIYPVLYKNEAIYSSTYFTYAPTSLFNSDMYGHVVKIGEDAYIVVNGSYLLLKVTESTVG